MPLHGHDLRNSIGMADDVMSEVQQELKGLARASRIQVLEGGTRKDFLKGMTQEEFDILHSLAMEMGPRGMTALERIMQEASDLFGDESSSPSNSGG